MLKKISTLFFLLCAITLLNPGDLFAQEATVTPETKTALENQLAQIEAQIADLEKELAHTTGQKKTLTNAIKRLRQEAIGVRLQIKSVTIRLNDLTHKLADTKAAMAVNLARQERLRQELAQTLRLLQQRDTSIIFSLLSAGGLAGTWSAMETDIKINASLKNILDATQSIHQTLALQQTKYNQQTDETQQLLSLKQLAEQNLSSKISEQNKLLVATKGAEATYQQQLADTKKRAAEIRNRIYELFNATQQVNFGDALKIATWVEGVTGVRAAMLLAVLTQESNLGKNVGTCNRAGDPPEKSWRWVMKPDRDQAPFQQITTELGLEIDTTPVSCRQKDSQGNYFGWGGAMGPAQFIPSTWLGYRAQVSKVTGKTPSNPWDIRDAFVAAGLKLRSNGADGTAQGEWNAAMRYFSGSTNVRFRFYGDNVASLTQKYQNDIDTLNQAAKQSP